MGYAYLFAAIVGVALLVGSLVIGDHDGDSGGDGGHDTGGEGMAAGLLSVRAWTHILAFGGLTGLLLRGVAGTEEPLAGILAGTVGVVSGLAARWAFAKASASAGGGTVKPAELMGRTGKLLLPCGPGLTGQVRLTTHGRIVDLLARTSHPGELAAGLEVLVVRVDGGEALVLPVDDDDPAPSNTGVIRPTAPREDPLGLGPASATLADPTHDVDRTGDKELT